MGFPERTNRLARPRDRGPQIAQRFGGRGARGVAPSNQGVNTNMAITKGRSSSANSTSTLKIGDTAPEIELGSHNSEERWKLSSLKGKNVVLAFYPFAFTAV